MIRSPRDLERATTAPKPSWIFGYSNLDPHELASVHTLRVRVRVRARARAVVCITAVAAARTRAGTSIAVIGAAAHDDGCAATKATLNEWLAKLSDFGEE